MRKAWFWIAALALLSGCKTPPPPFTGPEPREKVLIAAEKTEFKDAVVSRVTERLRQQGVSCRVVELRELRWFTMDAHEVVVAVHGVWAWRLSRPVRQFLDKTPPAQWYRVIVVSTARGEDWQPSQVDLGVEAITSASEPGKTEGVANFIISRIQAIRSRR